MGTREYLAKLDLGQLRHAREVVAELIGEKEKEQNLVVWCVSDRDMILETFGDGDYVKAAEKLLEQARENAACPPGNLNAREKELHLTARFVPASEYGEWVSVPANREIRKRGRSMSSAAAVQRPPLPPGCGYQPAKNARLIDPPGDE